MRACTLIKTPQPTALDLGAGQGRNAIYLQRHGFSVTAVDISKTAISQIRTKDDEINAICADISTFAYPKQFDLIISINALHFLEKSTIKTSIDEMKKHLRAKGVIAISLLLDNNKIDLVELEQLFQGLQIVLSRENIIQDSSHAGMEYPHEHRIAMLIAANS